MKTHDEATQLRATLKKRGGARGKRFSPELRSRVIGYAKRRRSEGASWMTIAKELGACFETVRRWCEHSKSVVARVRPVEIVVDRLPTSAAPTVLKIVTPNGLRVEGLGVEEVVALVRALG